jgi:hypothetical protein
MREIGSEQPRVIPTTRDVPIEEMTYTVRDYYAHRAEPRVDVPRWFDGDLKQLFEDEPGEGRVSAAPFLREKRLNLINEVSYWTGVQMGIVRSLVDHLLDRTSALDLNLIESDVHRYLVSFAAMVTTLSLNYLHHDKFAPDLRLRKTDR